MNGIPSDGTTQGEVVIAAAATLRELAGTALQRAGAPEATATTVAGSLVEGNLLGHDSHGVRRVATYTGLIGDGDIDPAAQPALDREQGAVTVVDGARGFGQLAAALAVEELRGRARELGMGAATIRRCGHVGRLGEWVEALAAEGNVAFAFCNADPFVAPFGGRERRLGTNPLAWAAPRGGGRPPLVMDWATAAVAEGKVAVALARGERVDADAIIDADGHVSHDPADLYAGGALLPFGAHKGSGLSVMIELIGGALSGAGVSALPGHGMGNGTVLIALDVAAFAPRDEFEAQADAFCDLLAQTAPAAGFDEVLVPGEPERRTRERRIVEGVPVPAATWSELLGLAGRG